MSKLHIKTWFPTHYFDQTRITMLDVDTHFEVFRTLTSNNVSAFKWTIVVVRKIPKVQVKYNHKVTKSISTFCLSVPQHPVVPLQHYKMRNAPLNSQTFLLWSLLLESSVFISSFTAFLCLESKSNEMKESFLENKLSWN